MSLRDKVKAKKIWFVFGVGTTGPILGFFGRWNWFLDFFNNFRLQLTVVLCFTFFYLLVYKDAKKLFISGVVLLGCFISLVPYFNLPFNNTAFLDNKGELLDIEKFSSAGNSGPYF